MSIYFEKFPHLLTTTVLQLRYATLTLSRCAFTSFRNCLRNSIVSLLKSSLISMFVPLSLFSFCRIFTLSLYLSRLHVIVRRLLPLFVLFCLPDVRCARSISIGHSRPSFSWNTCCSFSSQFSHVSPGLSRIPSTQVICPCSIF